jgi:hypothetical protein
MEQKVTKNHWEITPLLAKISQYLFIFVRLLVKIKFY